MSHNRNSLQVLQQKQINELKTIANNTSSVNVNTDTLEALQTTANTSLSVAETKLTNLQTINDQKLSAIQNFLDKDHAQFHLAHHPTLSKGDAVISAGAGGLQQVLIYGRKDDGTLQPVETAGDRLLVDVVELAASGKITTSTALSSMQVCGFDSDLTNKFKTLACDFNGRLNTFQKLENDSINSSLSVVDGGAGTDTAEIEIKSKPYKGKIAIVIENADITASNISVTPKFSTSSGGTLHLLDISHMELTDTGNCKIIIVKDFVPPFLKINIFQNSGQAVLMDVKAIY
jgi:hypothetical protein